MAVYKLPVAKPKTNPSSPNSYICPREFVSRNYGHIAESENVNKRHDLVCPLISFCAFLYIYILITVFSAFNTHNNEFQLYSTMQRIDASEEAYCKSCLLK